MLFYLTVTGLHGSHIMSTQIPIDLVATCLQSSSAANFCVLCMLVCVSCAIHFECTVLHKGNTLLVLTNFSCVVSKRSADVAGVSDNRLQNVVITLDKVKLCLERPGEPNTSCLAWRTSHLQIHKYSFIHSLIHDKGLLGRLCSPTTRYIKAQSAASMDVCGHINSVPLLHARPHLAIQRDIRQCSASDSGIARKELAST